MSAASPYPLTGSDPISYPYSSYQYYLGYKNAPWVKPQFILEYFQSNHSLFPKGINSYQKFVEDYLANAKEFLGTLTLED